MQKSIYAHPSPIHDKIITLIGEGYGDRKIGEAIDGINYQCVFRFRRCNGIPPGSTFRKKPRKLALPIKQRYEKQPIIDYCLSLTETYQDRVHSTIKGKLPFVITRAGRLAFAFVFEYEGKLCVNVKCDPKEAVVFRRTYKSVIPAYLMNKNTRKHWNTVIVGDDVPEQTLREMILRSYESTKPKVREMSINAKLKEEWGINVKEACTSYVKRGWIKKEKPSKYTRSRYNSRIEKLRQKKLSEIHAKS